MFRKLHIIMAGLGAALVVSVNVGMPAYAACGGAVLGIPPWYNNLTEDTGTAGCSVKSPDSANPDSLRNFVLVVALNILQAALVIVGYITVIFIIKGAFLYVIARGESGNIASGKQTITNAIIGLVIALLAAGIVGAVSKAISN